MAVACWCILWNLSIRDTACCPHYIELCTKLPLNESHLSIENRQLGPNDATVERFHIHIARCCTTSSCCWAATDVLVSVWWEWM